MNKCKKTDPKKILVRNTELAVPKTKLIIEEKSQKIEKKKPEEPRAHRPRSENVPPRFHVPELNSALKITQKMDKMGITKNQAEKKSSEVAFCEKVTRRINFPTDKAIYKDLIPLRVPAKSPPILSSRDPLPQKDREPVLSSYTAPTQAKEYIYQPSVKFENRSSSPQLNNLRLYKKIQMNS